MDLSKPVSTNLHAVRPSIDPQERSLKTGHLPLTVWLTGLSGAGKTTLGSEFERRLFDAGLSVQLLDADRLRTGLCGDLGFSPVDRRENIRRVAEVARLFNEAGLIVIVTLISPLAADRSLAHSIIKPEFFLEVYVSTAVDECERRDPYGLYRRARDGQIPSFTGVSAPYEAPSAPDLELNTFQVDRAEGVKKLFAATLARVRPALD